MRTWILSGCAALVLVSACGGGGGGTGGIGGKDTTTKTSTTSQSTTNSGTGGAASACGSRPWGSSSAACNACMEESCCDALRTCDESQACGELFDCLKQCAPGNDNCVTACQTAHAAGQGDLDALLGCYDLHCKESPSCGTKVCDTGISVSSQACGDCLTTSCCDSWKLCSQEPGCLDCLLSPDAACAGDPLYQSAVGCQDTSCGPLCATNICDTPLGYPDQPACNHCLGKLDADGGCCEETEACAADPTCLGCITGQTTTGCATNAALADFDACRAKCGAECN